MPDREVWEFRVLVEASEYDALQVADLIVGSINEFGRSVSSSVVVTYSEFIGPEATGPGSIRREFAGSFPDDATEPKAVLSCYPDWGAESPLWSEEGRMVATESLPLPPDLARRIDAWVADGAVERYDESAVLEQGRTLLGEASAALAGTHRIVTDWFDPDDG